RDRHDDPLRRARPPLLGDAVQLDALRDLPQLLVLDLRQERLPPRPPPPRRAPLRDRRPPRRHVLTRPDVNGTRRLRFHRGNSDRFVPVRSRSQAVRPVQGRGLASFAWPPGPMTVYLPGAVQP